MSRPRHRLATRIAPAALLLACWSCSASKPPPRLADDAGLEPTTAASSPKPAIGDAADDNPMPFEECPVTPGTDEPSAGLIERYLDQAATSFDADRFAEAYTCADHAADLEPTSVEAAHLRASALAALARDGDAQVAYSRALALDPEDPETLRAIADFYINVMASRGRDAVIAGLELARRGTARATARRRGNGDLRAALALLEAQALNDLGHADEAAERAGEALRLSPGLIDADHERGVALFNLGKFDDAMAAFSRVLVIRPDDAYAHHFLGLVLEQLGRRGDAEGHFDRAQELDAEQFPPPVTISVAEFRAEIDAVLSDLEPARRAKVATVPILIEDFPDRADLAAVDPPFPPTILGLFRGMPHGVELPPPADGSPPPPRAIVLYRLNLARAVKTRDELSAQIRRTLLHEIGHLEGLDEDDLRRRGLD